MTDYTAFDPLLSDTTPQKLMRNLLAPEQGDLFREVEVPLVSTLSPPAEQELTFQLAWLGFVRTY